MHYYCDVRHKTTKLKFEKIQRKSLTHIQYEKVFEKIILIKIQISPM